MAIRKFNSLSEAALAGFTIDLGNGEYAEGGTEIPRGRYAALYNSVSKLGGPTEDTTGNFSVPDNRGHFLPAKPPAL